jgi:hypothetical protein
LDAHGATIRGNRFPILIATLLAGSAFLPAIAPRQLSSRLPLSAASVGLRSRGTWSRHLG